MSYCAMLTVIFFLKDTESTSIEQKSDFSSLNLLLNQNQEYHQGDEKVKVV